jgi:drug/metabolite transporter (DMT)-like permease
MVWGGSIVAQKIALQSWNPYFVLFIRGSGTLVLILPYLWVRQQFEWNALYRDRKILFWMGLSGLANSLFVLFGLQYTSAIEAGMIMGVGPFLMAFLLKLLGRQTLNVNGWLAASLTVIGVALVVFRPEESTGNFEYIWIGNLLVFFGVFSWSIYTILSKEVMTRHSPFLIMALTWVGVLALAPFAWENQVPIGGNVLSGWIALAYIVVAATVLGFSLWLIGLHTIGSAHSMVYLNLIPLSAILFSALFLGETIRWRQWVGGGMILAGAWVVSLIEEKQVIRRVSGNS